MHKYCTDKEREVKRESSTRFLYLVTIPLTTILNKKVIPCICTLANEHQYLKEIMDLLVNYNVLTLSVSYILIFALLYILVNRVLWHMHIFFFLFKMPDIRGVWSGTLKSSYKNTEVKVQLYIKQYLHDISIKAYFMNQDNKESRSYSTMACLVPSGVGITHLSYVYKNEAEIGKKFHDGLCQIKITRKANEKEKMDGDYFTNRTINGTPPFTYGEMHLEKCSNQEAKRFRKEHKRES